jgi:hypothetical protein
LSGSLNSEFASVELGDERLNKRLSLLAERLMDSPQSSIQSACRSWDETMGAYRFLGNAEVEADAILESHRDALEGRIGVEEPGEDLLYIQDTTELDYTSQKQMEGTGPLGKAGNNTRQGFFLHSHYVVTESGLPLGTYGAKLYARDESKSKSKPLDPIEGKESVRWLEGYQRACELAAKLRDREVWVVNDREGDIYELFACREQRLQAGLPAAQLVVRANRNRCLLDEQGQGLYDKAAEGKVMGTIEFELKAGPSKRLKGFKQTPSRKARRVTQQLRVSALRPRPPRRTGQKLPALSLWTIQAEEIDPPEGEQPLSWLLISTAPVKDFAQARKLVQYYTRRWQIEVFFRILKTGCRVEQLQLKNERSVRNALMLYSLIAWRIHYLVYLGRHCPDLPCSVLFEVHEWRATLAVARYQKNRKAKAKNPVSIPAKEEEPSLAEMILILAKLGGYLARKNDPPPGAQSLWQGMIQSIHYAQAWEAMGHPMD